MRNYFSINTNLQWQIQAGAENIKRATAVYGGALSHDAFMSVFHKYCGLYVEYIIEEKTEEAGHL